MPSSLVSLRHILFLFLLLPYCHAEKDVRIPTVSPWSLRAHYPLGVFEAGGGVLWSSRTRSPEYIVFGGFHRFPGITTSVYSLSLYRGVNWKRRKDMPEPLTHMAQAIHGRYFYGAGGYFGRHPGMSSRSVWRYDIDSDIWLRLPSLPARRAGGGLTVVQENGQVFLVFSGGVDRSTPSLKFHTDHGDTWRLNLNNLALGWMNDYAPLMQPRNHMAAVRTCGRYFWVGGQKLIDEHYGNSKLLNEYLPRERMWKVPAPAHLPYGLGHISASVLPYRCGILVIGGMSWGRTRIRSVLFWEPTQNKWHHVGDFPKGVATPVCGLHANTLICSTGETDRPDEVYVANIALRKLE